MARGSAGPFRSERFASDSTVYNKPAWFGTYTITNASGAAVTVTFYDDNAGGTSNPIEQVIVPANSSMSVYPNGDTLLGLGVKCSLWTSVTAFVRWAPR